MKYLKKFEKYTNKTILYYSVLIKKIYDEIKDLSTDITYDFGLEEDELFKINNCHLIFNKSNEDKGLFTPSTINDIKNNTISDCEIIINFTDEKYIVELAAHELQHCYEYIQLNKIIKSYNIEELPEFRKTMSFKINKTLTNIDYDIRKLSLITNEFEKFVYVVKNTFNSEYNARTTQLYGCLLKFDTNIQILNNEITKSKTYMIYKLLEKYINSNFYENLIYSIGEKNLLNITNKFNNILISEDIKDIHGYEFIKIINKNELENYYNSWKKLFKYKNDKHYNKIKNISNDVMKNKNDKLRNNLKEDISFETFSKWIKEDEIKYNRIKKLNRIV